MSAALLAVLVCMLPAFGRERTSQLCQCAALLWWRTIMVQGIMHMDSHKYVTTAAALPCSVRVHTNEVNGSLEVCLLFLCECWQVLTHGHLHT